VPTGQVLAGFAPISRANRRIVLQEWLAEAFTMWEVAAVVIAVTAVGGAGSRSGIWVYRAAAGLLVALGTLTALTGARTPVVWFKICPVLLAGGALRRAPGPPHRGRLRMLGSPAEADDAVREAWLRFSRSDTSDVENLGSWITTVVSRVCLGGAATDAELTYAKRVSELPKSVASNTLTKATGHTTILRREAAGQIADLKSWSRGNLLLMYGPSLLAALSDHGLVDRYMLDVYPIALG